MKSVTLTAFCPQLSAAHAWQESEGTGSTLAIAIGRAVDELLTLPQRKGQADLNPEINGRGGGVGGEAHLTSRTSKQKSDRSNRWGLYIESDGDTELLGSYGSAVAAADDVYTQNTGWDEWDVPARIDAPTGLDEWEQRSNGWG